MALRSLLLAHHLRIVSSLSGPEIVGVLGAQRDSDSQLWGTVKIRTPPGVPGLVSYRFDDRGRIVDMRVAAVRVTGYVQDAWRRRVEEAGIDAALATLETRALLGW